MTENNKAVVLDIGGTFIKSGLVNSKGKILKSEKTPTQACEGKAAVLANLQVAYEKVYEESVCGLGIGVPGCVEPQTGEVSAVDNIPCLSGLRLTEAFGTLFVPMKFKGLSGLRLTENSGNPLGVPVFIDNDANNAAKGEYLFGPGRKKKNFMAVALGTGVGGGLILNGQFYRGANNYSGEIGHMTYIPDGMACNCGKRGCLEAYASATAVIRSAKSMVKRDLPTRLNEHDPEKFNAQLICDLARQGDSLCQSIVRDAAKALGTVLGTATNLLNLECITVGGGLSAAGDILIDPLRLYASRHTLPKAYERCEILLSDLGNDAALLGGAAAVFMELEKV